MASTFHFFRDTLQINLNTIRALNAPGGATIVFGARSITLSELISGYSYVIAADELKVPSGVVAIQNSDATTPASVTVLAQKIDGALRVSVAGVAGEAGANGEPGESGIEPSDPPGGKPVVLPGGNGGNGGDGENGGPGGNITVRYASATTTPTGAVPGGAGGAAGHGGPGGAGRPPGKPGRAGKPGRSGAAGVVSIQQIAAEQVFQSLDSASAKEWAAYRAEVAGFLFRKFDFDSQLAALNEAGAALLLNPADADAATVQSRIVQRQIPSGLPRDLDIAPDYPALSANLPAEVAIVQNAFQAFVSVVSLETIADTLREQLKVMRTQLENRTEEAQADVVIANGRVRAGYHVGALVDADVVAHLIGERPGTGLDTMSVYLTYGRHPDGRSRWRRDLEHSATTAVCGIHRHGKSPQQAVDELTRLIRRIVETRRSGVALEARASRS